MSFDDRDDDLFSEAAKHKYLNNNDSSAVATSSSGANESHSSEQQQYQWNIPNAESGSYLNTLESKLFKITNGRGLGRSLRMGGSTTSVTITTTQRKKKIEYSSGGSGGNCKKCLDYFEEDIDLTNIPKEELIGSTPLLLMESIVVAVSNTTGSTTTTTVGPNYNTSEESSLDSFEDLQVKELEEDGSWHQDYTINGEEKQVIKYDKKTGELVQEEDRHNMVEENGLKDILDNESEEEEISEDDDDEDDEDVYNDTAMELHDNEEDNDDAFEHYQTNVTTENDDDDWVAEFQLL